MYDDPMVQISFSVPKSIRDRLRRYADYTKFSMTDIFRCMVSELRVDPYQSTQDQIESATLRTQLFMGTPEDGNKKPLVVAQDDGFGRTAQKTWWKKVSF